MDKQNRNNTFHADVVQGQLLFKLPADFHGYVAKQEGLPVVVTVERLYHKRSMEQNKYYWGVVIKLISEDIGEHPSEVHAMLKRMFLAPRLLDIKGHTYEVERSTSSISTVDFMQYLDTIIAWAAQALAVVIPDANTA